ncbi:MAG: zf-HC2 domain-containing protein [Myxococcota bacterium]
MNCEQCERQLLSLLEEDLPPDEAERTRAHLSECGSCRASLDRLEAGHRWAALLPMEEPDPSLDEPILQAARAKAGARAPSGDGAAPDGEDGGGGRWTALVEWLRGLTLGPQVAMAMVMLLVVGIGLLYLPDLRRRPGLQGEPVLEPDPQGEAAPTAAPAETPEQATGPTGEGEEAPAEEPRARAGDDDSPAAREAEASPPAAARKAGGEAQRKKKPARQRAAAPKRSRSAESPSAEADGRGAPLAESQAFEGESAGTARGAPSGGNVSASGADGQEAAPAADRSAADTPRTAPRDDVLARARRERASGDCRAALSGYERFLGSTPRHPERSKAMLEVADCYRRVGRDDRARHWLRLASREPDTAAIARQRLRAMAEEEAAAAEIEPAQ